MVVEVYLYQTDKQLKCTVYDLVVVGVVQEDLKKDRFLIWRRTGREKDSPIVLPSHDSNYATNPLTSKRLIINSRSGGKRDGDLSFYVLNKREMSLFATGNDVGIDQVKHFQEKNALQ